MTTVTDDKLRFGKNLIKLFGDPVAKEDAIETLADILYRGGYVHESYGLAVINREKVYPTGLPTQPIGVAIPHTDTEHVIKSALAIGLLSQPVSFQEMGSFDGQVEVSIISMMAISDPKLVMPVLRNLALAYQDGSFLVSLKNAANAEDVLVLFQQRIPDVITLA